ncbi:hypothetical protein VTL71DRAFT_14605 [Oculimacula yallundae]|uniref:Cyanate hydratase n=1 Tax=Oculimacula yallundae TaxID=86028 RepID=A0ABR4CIY5_9HELO
MASQPIATLDESIIPRLPAVSPKLFAAKAAKKLTFEALAKELDRSEVAVAALFYGQAQPNAADISKLAQILSLDEAELAALTPANIIVFHLDYAGFPDRGRAGPMPPVEPLIYRLYEIVQNYGYAYKAVINEKFGDGIMSAIAFSTKVDKEVDDQGVTWVNISLRGKCANLQQDYILRRLERSVALPYTGLQIKALRSELPLELQQTKPGQMHYSLIPKFPNIEFVVTLYDPLIRTRPCLYYQLSQPHNHITDDHLKLEDASLKYVKTSQFSLTYTKSPTATYEAHYVDFLSPSGSFVPDSCWPSPESWSALNVSVSGKLIKTTPPAAVCYPGPEKNLAACAAVLTDLTNSTYIANNPIALDYPIKETCPVVNYTAGALPGDCIIGSLPVYAVNASSPEDVSQAVNFARAHNIRFVVRNTGHDILGRSTGYGSLEVWIRHLRQGIQFQKRYIASDRSTESGWTGSAFFIGGGYVWGDVYAEANKRNVVVVGGGNPSVGCIGGWAQGGGHSPASRNYGLGADQILEAQVVLASGEIVTANACQNTDVFFAIRGGGGGTYGVVVSTVVKAYPSTPVVAQVFQIAPVNDTYIPEFMEALAIIYDSYPALNDGGFSGYGSWAVRSYAPVVSTYFSGYQHVFAVFNQTLSSAQATFAPVAARLAPYNRTSLSISTTYSSFPSYQSYYTTLSGVQSPVGTSGAVGSRLLDRAALTYSPALKTMLNVTAGLPGQFAQSNVCMVSGGQVFADAHDPNSGVNPAWRTSYVHNLVARGLPPRSNAAELQAVHDDITYTKVGAMRDLAPETGSYMNEADRLDPLFLENFYGGSLERLREVKRKYDPTDLFYCPTCVGSENWHEDSSGRLCRNV